jgi:hypothetical protein
MKRSKGYIVYEGPSEIDGGPIVAIVTNSSSNPKTGNIMQLWIMRADVRPTQATKGGEDRSVCGDCKHRHFNNGTCYVMPFTGPLGVWKAYKKGIYDILEDFNIFNDRVLRFGAYGDPHALPIDILVSIKTNVRNSTSYTHLWKTLNESELNASKKFTMASVDNLNEKHEAQLLGFRTFRVVKDYAEMESDEIICPNITRKLTCIECKLCNGNRNGNNVKNIVIQSHGVKSKRKLKKIG